MDKRRLRASGGNENMALECWNAFPRPVFALAYSHQESLFSLTFQPH